MKLKLPASVNAIINSLQAKGYEAYAVGGCVRDSILNREPEDWDITTSATPWQVKDIFNRTVDTGISHGTVTVLIGNNAHEVTTYRIDGDYEDGRHPSEVTFTASLEEDLRRRDFTINAMAYNDDSGLIDLYGGVEDLQHKCIQCVGNAEARFGEDALRILRALRFAAQLDFGIEQATYDAICKLSGTLSKISAERIAAEMTKLLLSGHPEYIQYAFDTGITSVILPEFDAMMNTAQNNPHHCYDVGHHTIESLKYISADKVLRITMLLHDVGKPGCRVTDEDGIDHFKGHAMEGMELSREILQRLKFDNDTIYQVTNLIKWHDCRMEPSMKMVRKVLNKLGPDLFGKLLKVQYADTMAQSGFCRKEKLQNISEVERCFQEIMDSKQCISLKDLKLTGQDLITMGMKPGPQIGELLNRALDQVLEYPEKNQRDYLLFYIKTLIKEEKENK